MGHRSSKILKPNIRQATTTAEAPLTQALPTQASRSSSPVLSSHPSKFETFARSTTETLQEEPQLAHQPQELEGEEIYATPRRSESINITVRATSRRTGIPINFHIESPTALDSSATEASSLTSLNTNKTTKIIIIFSKMDSGESDQKSAAGAAQEEMTSSSHYQAMASSLKSGSGYVNASGGGALSNSSVNVSIDSTANPTQEVELVVREETEHDDSIKPLTSNTARAAGSSWQDDRAGAASMSAPTSSSSCSSCFSSTNSTPARSTSNPQSPAAWTPPHHLQQRQNNDVLIPIDHQSRYLLLPPNILVERIEDNAIRLVTTTAPTAPAAVATTSSMAATQSNDRSIGAVQRQPPIVHSQVDYVHCLVPDLDRITNCNFYWGKMDRYEAERLLEGKPEGTFLLRDSAQEEYLFSVTFRKFGRSLHARIEQAGNRFSFDCHDPSVYTANTVTGLLEHYKDPACVMFFEPMLTIPLHRRNPFSLQQLCRATITSRTTYDGIEKLELPGQVKAYLRVYHYKQKLRVKSYVDGACVIHQQPMQYLPGCT